MNLPEDRAPHDALVVAEEAAFSLQGDDAGGEEFEGDVRGGRDA